MEQLDLAESGKRKTESGTRDESGIRGIRDERGKRKAESGKWMGAFSGCTKSAVDTS